MSNQVLRLTCTIKESNVAGIFIGKINEIGGIFAQAGSAQEVYTDLVNHTYMMLPRKREQAIALLQKQTEEHWDELLGGPIPTFKLTICNSSELEAA